MTAVFDILRRSAAGWLLAAVLTAAYLLLPASASLLSLSTDLLVDLSEPWRLITYSLLHVSAAHLAVNTLGLLVVSIVCRMGAARLLTAFALGSLGGAVAFVAMCSAAGIEGSMVGASAAVFGVAAAGSLLARSRLLLAATVMLVAFGFMSHNVAGAIAHVGGFTAGMTYALALTRRRRCVADPLALKAQLSGYESLTADERRRLVGEDTDTP